MAPKHNKKHHDDHEEDDSKIFPQRLMEILADPRSQDSICWLPHGRAFIVRKRDEFAANVMPRYFPRKAKYSSFTRKLNRWNFIRVSSGPELGAYYHEFFLRDKPHLAAQMFCKNARSVLAMASDKPNPTASTVEHPPSPQRNEIQQPPPVQPQQPQPTQQQLQQPLATHASVAAAPAAHGPGGINTGSLPPITPALLAALTKNPALGEDKTDVYAGGAPAPAGPAAAGLLNSYTAPTTNVQLLEMHIRQQEQANRILLEHAMALSIQQRQEQQAKLAAEQARLSQMRQLMELRLQQQQDRNPSNPRASAA